LTWTDTATNETAFVIERSTDGVNFAQVGTAAPRTGSTGLIRTFNDAAVSAGQTYSYRVVAQNVTGASVSNSGPSNVVSVTYALVAPSGLTATIARNNRITLNWIDTTNAEASFAVWRSVGGAAATQIGTVTRSAALGAATGGAVTFNDNTTFVLGTTYTYYVTAVNGTVASPASNMIDVPFLAPAAPTVPTAVVTTTSATRATVALSWTAVTGASSYTVQRTSPGGIVTVANNTTALSASQTNVLRNATVPYTYAVRANGVAGNSVATPVSVLVN
jgi:titin